MEECIDEFLCIAQSINSYGTVTSNVQVWDMWEWFCVGVKYVCTSTSMLTYRFLSAYHCINLCCLFMHRMDLTGQQCWHMGPLVYKLSWEAFRLLLYNGMECVCVCVCVREREYNWYCIGLLKLHTSCLYASWWCMVSIMLQAMSAYWQLKPTHHLTGSQSSGSMYATDTSHFTLRMLMWAN